jgi:alpha-beta hydrolase superfamily lysophospholipase
VHVLGHSTGGSIVMQLIADHPQVVRRAVEASAAYALGPVARRAQLNMLRSLETTGRFAAEELVDGITTSLAESSPKASVTDGVPPDQRRESHRHRGHDQS